MPIWMWAIVITGLAYGLYEVSFRDRRNQSHRVRALRHEADRRGMVYLDQETRREVSLLLVLLQSTGDAGDARHILRGTLRDGTPITIFDYLERRPAAVPRRRTGFVLHFDTDWPTFELGEAGPEPGPTVGNSVDHDAPGVGSGTGGSPRWERAEHMFSGTLLASEVTEFLARCRGWTFAFSGPWVFGATDELPAADLDTVIEIGRGITERLPRSLISQWPDRGDAAPRRAG